MPTVWWRWRLIKKMAWQTVFVGSVKSPKLCDTTHATYLEKLHAEEDLNSASRDVEEDARY